MKDSIHDYIESGGWIIEDKKTKEFEKMIAEYTGSKYCIVTTSGTAALYMSILAVSQTIEKLSPKRYIAVPDYTFIATANAAFQAGYTPVLFDVEMDTFCMSPIYHGHDKYFKSCNIIILASLNGRYPKAFDKILELCKDHNIPLIEDAAQSLGSHHKGKHVGTYGDVGILSFSPPKLITTGQGGAIITDNKKIYDKVKLLKNFGREQIGVDVHSSIGYNYKYTDLQAVLGISQMKDIKKRISKKRKIYKLYTELLEDNKHIRLIKNKKETLSYQMDILHDYPRDMQEALYDNGIQSRKFYPAVHTVKPYSNMSSEQSFIQYNSNVVSSDGVYLPSSYSLEDEDIKLICDIINKL